MISPLDSAPPLCRLSAAELTAGYQRGDFTPSEVVEAALGRAEDIQPGLNAFTLIDRDGARYAAAEATQRWAAGTPRGIAGRRPGHDLRDWHQTPGAGPVAPATAGWEGLRVGLWSVPPRGTVSPQVATGLAGAVDRIRAMGATVEMISLPEGDLDRIFRVHWFTGAAARLRLIPANLRGQIDRGFREIAAEGAAFSAADYLDSSTARARFGAAMDRLLTEFDVIVSPGTSIVAFRAGLEVPEGSGLERWTEWAGFSLQIVGARGQDARVLALAAAYERTHPFTTREMTRPRRNR